VRVADEIVVDLMGRACGLSYAEAQLLVALSRIKLARVHFKNLRAARKSLLFISISPKPLGSL
jgi:hypothetical protein